MGPLMSSRTTVLMALGVKGSFIIRREIFVEWARMRRDVSRARDRAFMEVVSGEEEEEGVVGVCGLRWMVVSVDWSCSRRAVAVAMSVARALRDSSSLGAILLLISCRVVDGDDASQFCWCWRGLVLLFFSSPTFSALLPPGTDLLPRLRCSRTFTVQGSFYSGDLPLECSPVP